MNFFEYIKKDLIDKLVTCDEFKNADFSRVSVEPPRESSHGDIATNIAMVVAGKLKKSPRELAVVIAEKAKENPYVESVSIAGPGFINLKMSNDFWYRQVQAILAAGADYGCSEIGAKEKVNVEFVSVNPTGPMHVGHARGAVYGDALANLLRKSGYDVAKEYYINDAGAQVYKLARSAYLRYKEALGLDIGEIGDGYYPGEYLKDVGRKIAAQDGNKWLEKDESVWLEYFREIAVKAMMELIKADLHELGVVFDVFASEREIALSGEVEKAVQVLRDQNLVYEGFLEKPKSKKVADDWEPTKMTIFRSTEFGDDSDRPLMREDGSYTYFTPDIAYHLNKFERGFTKMIDVWGADHAGYVKRMKTAVQAVTKGKGELDVKLCQIMNFMDNGKPVKLSKRSGTFITLKDVLEEVGKDTTRFFIMSHKNDTHMDFDFAKVKEQSKENPIFYVQYAHARCASVIRLAKEMFGDISADSTDLSVLTDETEIELIKVMSDFPRQVEAAARAYEPHRIGYYLYDLAGVFHKLWNKGKSDTHLRFLNAEMPELSRARVALITAFMDVIASGLAIFAVKPLEEM